MNCAIVRRKRQEGYATVVVLILIVLMTALTALNVEVAFRLHRSVKQLEQRQLNRWQTAAENSRTAPEALLPPGVQK